MSESKSFQDVKELLQEHGELSTARVGDKLWGGSASEQNWQKYTLPAAALLRRAEKKGIVKSRWDHSSKEGYSRTFWYLPGS